MSPDVLWNVKGVRREAREQARMAAQQSGMSVGEWLNSVIIESAEEIAAPRRGSADRRGHPAGTRRAPPVDSERLADVLLRLDRRLEQLLSHGREPGAGVSPTEDDADFAEADSLRDVWSKDADVGVEPPQRGGLLASADGPPPDLSGLERQLQRITAQIESLQRPASNDDVTGALREEIAAIGRMLVDAVPRRTLDALEREVRRLSERLAQDSQARPGSAEFDGIERALADVRATIARLVPAETAHALHEAVKALAGKVDQLSGAGRDSTVLQQIEATLTAVRGMLANVASRDALTELAGELRVLTVRVDRALAIGNSSSELLRTIDKRITALAAAIESDRRGTPGHSAGLDAMIVGLGEKIDRLRSTHDEQGGIDSAALGQLEQRIAALVEKLDASESRFSRFATLERGLAALSAQLEGMRSTTTAAAPQPSDGDGHLRGPASTPAATGVSAPSETQRIAYGHMIDRLATIDAEMRRDSQSQRADAAGAAASSSPRNAGERPSEPVRRPPAESGSAAERIAASRAALGPNVPPAADASKSDFIAAARRAAQAAAAVEREEPAPLRPEGRNAGRIDPRPDRNNAGRLVKSLVVGTGVVVVTLGALRLGLNESGPDPRSATPNTHTARVESSLRAPPAPRIQSASPAARNPVVEPPPHATAANRAGSDPLLEGAPASGLVMADPVAGPAANSASGRTPGARSNEITGSIPLSPSGGSESRGSVPMKIDPAIGGPLAAAAAAGDPAAAYELATRYAEGRTVAANLEEAARWFERAAGQGLAPAQFRLGSLYEKGQGVKKDLQEARRLYLAAADKGNAKAMHNLAVLYAEGIDGKPDYQTAVQWFREAADRDVSDSQYNLGVLYARGIGVERNLAESFKWFTLAANHGDGDAARKRDEVAARLNPSSLAAARAAAQSWRPKPQPPEAVTVPTPPGGWDRSSVGTAPVKPARTRIQAAQKTSSL
ncbi:MAG TPA: hypothetical protein VHA77_16615 [Xanthobacteraceae bacterium]|jgi:localization factor PodJL|nr:hypothetical protein [Xanthobacteraceae bacterium]